MNQHILTGITGIGMIQASSYVPSSETIQIITQILIAIITLYKLLKKKKNLNDKKTKK